MICKPTEGQAFGTTARGPVNTICDQENVASGQAPTIRARLCSVYVVKNTTKNPIQLPTTPTAE